VWGREGSEGKGKKVGDSISYLTREGEYFRLKSRKEEEKKARKD